MSSLVNFMDFFKDERNIYVQNISSCQVSISFDIAPGRSESYLFPNTKDPIELTRFIPFNAIKNSFDFRRMLVRQPQALKLMTEDDYMTYYNISANKNGLSGAAEAIVAADEKRSSVHNHIPLPSVDSVDEQKSSEVPKKIAAPISEEDVINPRILNLCLQVHPSLDPTQMMPAQDMLAEIDNIENLSMDDYQYLLSHGNYKSVKNFAKKNIQQLASKELDDDKSTKKPVKKPTKSKKVGDISSSN